MTSKTDPRVDAYIEQSAPFAQPILRHLRQLVHRACPEATETIKWSHIFFVQEKTLLCNLAAFKAHCAFGFWHQGMKKILRDDGTKSDAAMGSLGRITSLGDLPSDKTMTGYLQQAVKFSVSDLPSRPAAKPKPELPIPADFAAALKKVKPASATFEKFRPGQRRDYLEWITEAKREETRQKRITIAVEWLAEGKSRNWKYENC